MELRDQLRELLYFIVEATNRNIEKTISDKSIFDKFPSLPKDEIKAWLGELSSAGYIREISPKPSGVDFRLFSVTQKTLEESATNQLGR
jgi:hypothetical protein